MKINSLLFITSNSGKANELKNLLKLERLEIFHKPMKLPEIQSLDMQEIGKFKTKAATAFKKVTIEHDAVLTDDTALCCKALNGLPGPLIKWFLDCLGVNGLFELVKNKNRETSAKCLLTLGLTKINEIVQFEAEISGKLVSPKGGHGFGWDQIFLPNGYQQTFAEMPQEKKNKISHRALAIEKLRNWLVLKNI